MLFISLKCLFSVVLTVSTPLILLSAMCCVYINELMPCGKNKGILIYVHTNIYIKRHGKKRLTSLESTFYQGEKLYTDMRKIEYDKSLPR